MTESLMTLRERRLSLAAIVSTMAVTSLIYGFSYPLLALSLEQRGVDDTLIGLNTAIQGLAVFVAAPMAPRMISQFGAARVMLTSLVLCLVLFLSLAVFQNVNAWFVIRFLLGVANGLLWITGETWVNAFAKDQTRGRLIGLYSTALAAGYTLGPLVLAQIGSTGWPPFLLGAVMIAVSGTPLLFVGSLVPAIAKRSSLRLYAFLWLAPAAMAVNFTAAAADSALLTFLPIYGMDRGLGESAALYLIMALGIGGIACQLPLGWLADHLERRLLLTLCVAVAATAGLAMPMLTGLTPWNWLLMFVLGGLLGGLYTLGLVILGEQFSSTELAGATAVFSSMWGIGSVAGPPVAGGLMELLPPHGLPVSLVLMFLACLPFPLLLYWRRKGSIG